LGNESHQGQTNAVNNLFSPVLANLIPLDGSALGILLAVAVMIVIVFR
jgi:hypothetical protein